MTEKIEMDPYQDFFGDVDLATNILKFVSNEVSTVPYDADFRKCIDYSKHAVIGMARIIKEKNLDEKFVPWIITIDSSDHYTDQTQVIRHAMAMVKSDSSQILVIEPQNSQGFIIEDNMDAIRSMIVSHFNSHGRNLRPDFQFYSTRALPILDKG